MALKKSKGRMRWLRLAACILCVCLLLGGGLAVILGASLEARFEKDAPIERFRLSTIGRAPTFYVYHFTDRKNRQGVMEELDVGSFAKQSASLLEAVDIPKQLSDAFIAIEDKRFYKHHGVDWKRTLSAALNYAFGFSDHFGASTITQQVIKNMTGKSEVTLERKMQEIFYALDLERQMDKSEIMELYLNVIHFSDQCDGIVSAANHYFSKTPNELTLAECASLAAIVNSPSYYNPIRHPQNNLQRRNLILDQMKSQGMITDDEYSKALASPLALTVSEVSSGEEINSWYVDMAIDDVIEDLIREKGMSRAAASRLVYSGGIRIDLAMDQEIQSKVEEYYRTAIRLPTNANGDRAQSALIVIDNQTGDVLGVVGAVGTKKQNRLQNFATQTKRPPGSTIKPLTVYGPALERGLINWASVYDDVPVTFEGQYSYGWPRNATRTYRGLTNIAYAVAHSTNTVAVRVLEELGLENAFRFAKEGFHLESLLSGADANDCDLAALALGQLHYGVTLRELSAAYTVFADGGVYHPYRSYYRVLDADGNILLSKPDTSEIVLSEENAAIMTKLLEGVVRDGTSSEITLSRIVECAGKTGTTNKDGDRWFIGYTPELLCGVWCGYEYPEPLLGRNLCTKIWNDVMTQVTRSRDTKNTFDLPTKLIRVSYCKDSGLLMTDACAADPRGSRMEEGWFVEGSEPTRFCDCHVLCDYDAENGGVSHGYCPKDCIEQIGLIQVERHFPVEITVRDAPYVYRGEPMTLPPNGDAGKSYFDQVLGDFYGIARGERPYNASCPFHTKEWEDPDEYEDEASDGGAFEE